MSECHRNMSEYHGTMSEYRGNKRNEEPRP